MDKRVVIGCVLLGVLVLVIPRAAMAQEERPIEVFGSFSYLFADVAGSGFNDDVSGPGFTGGFAFFVNDWFGIGAEVGYNTGELDVDLPVIAIFPPPPLPDIGFSQWTVLFGPRFRISDSERFRFGAQAMAGIARGSTDVEFDEEELIIDIPGQGPRRFQLRAFDLQLSDTVFAALFGVHFDLKLRDGIVWRVVEPDILITNYGNDGQAHFRLSSGIGFEF